MILAGEGVTKMTGAAALSWQTKATQFSTKYRADIAKPPFYSNGSPVWFCAVTHRTEAAINHQRAAPVQ